LLSLSGGADREISLKGWLNSVGLDWADNNQGLYVGFVQSQGRVLVHSDFSGNVKILRQYKGAGRGMVWGIPSPDGRQIAIMGGAVSSNAWVLGGF
jgi:hypothetical protein